MNMRDLTTEDIENMSNEEKREFVRKLIHDDDEAACMTAAFYNPATGQSLDIKGLVEQIGEDAVIDIVVNAIENGETKAKSLNLDEIKELMEKAVRGECTEEELSMLNAITEKMNVDDSVHFERTWIDYTLNLINYAQKQTGFQPGLHDVYSACFILTCLSCIHTPNGAMSKYDPTDAGILTETTSMIAKDIYDTWAKSCETLPEPEFIIAALINLAGKIAFENKIKFSNAADMAANVGLTLDDYEDDDEDENGSNDTCDACGCNVCQPATYNATDKDMRDFLKE